MTARSAVTQAVVLTRRPQGQFTAADLGLAEFPLPQVEQGQALVRNIYMSIDPSTRGRMDVTEKQYTTNFEIGGPLDGSALGIVEESATPLLPVGAVVRHRLGWRERAVVDAAAVRVVDLDLAPAPAWLGALGQTGFTAWVGLTEIGQLAPDDVVLVSGAGGGVGSIAGQLARLLGASRVIGTAGGPEKCAWLTDDMGYNVAIDYRAGDISEPLAAAAPAGIDLFFDNVGGHQLVAALHQMKLDGRITLCGMMSNFGVTEQPSMSHLIEAVLRRTTLRGFIVRDHEAVRDEFEKRVAGWLSTGELVDRTSIVDGLENAPAALEGLLAGANFGKGLVRVGD
jgi:NADPH-dependent curcumin reductase CurA